ncbi:MAG: hypothetical protein JSS36_11155 [Proteobacteria bacterium]|nr:hypothetical protein [Pseudomonadota bacterium]
MKREAGGMTGGWPRWALVLLLGGLAFGLLLPVYSDEVVWRFAERAVIDGFDKLSADQCGPQTLAVPPWFMWPVRHWSAWWNLHFPDPLWVRLSGVGYAVVLAGMIWRFAGRVVRPERLGQARAMALAALALGVLPLVLVLSRPEQPILMALIGALMLADHGWRGRERQSLEAVALRCLLILALAVIALSYHTKATVLMPAFALCLATCGQGQGTRWPRGVAVAALVALALTAAHYWATRFSCPGDPEMARNIASQNVGALLLKSGRPLVAIAALFLNANLGRYFWLVAPAIKPMANWLPPGRLAFPAMAAWHAGLITAWSLTGLTTLAALATGTRQAWAARRWEPRLAMAGMLAVTVVAWGMAQTAKNVYDAGFVLPLIVLAALLALGGADRSGGWRGRGWRWQGRLAGALVLGAGVSLPLVVWLYGPPLAAAVRLPGGVIADQALSIPAWHYPAVRADVLGAARQCGIDPALRRPKAPLVDENSYFALMGAYRPQFHLGVVGVWHGGIKDPLAYLRSVGSDGMVVACHNLPPWLRGKARQQGEFCCIGPLGR